MSWPAWRRRARQSGWRLRWLSPISRCRTFLSEAVIPYEADEITRLIIDTHDLAAFRPWPISPSDHSASGCSLTRSHARCWPPWRPGHPGDGRGGFQADADSGSRRWSPAKCRVVTRFRNTLGLPGRLSTRLQPNHPTDDPQGIGASIIDGLLYGCGDAVIGINPASDSPATVATLLEMVDALRQRFAIPTQSCVLAHVTTTLQVMRARRPGGPGVPVDRRDRGRQPELRGHPLAAGEARDARWP